MTLSSMLIALKNRNIDKIVEVYKQSSNDIRHTQLKHFFESATINRNQFESYQNIAMHCAKSSGVPSTIVSGLNTLARVEFFFPILKVGDALDLTNHQANTFLHVLFANSEHAPPFNYIRSLFLFESNEQLFTVLTHKNKDSLTPLECYLAYNTHPEILPDFEIGAFIALIEILQHKSSESMEKNIPQAIVKQKHHLFKSQQKKLLISTLYGVSVYELESTLHS